MVGILQYVGFFGKNNLCCILVANVHDAFSALSFINYQTKMHSS